MQGMPPAERRMPMPDQKRPNILLITCDQLRYDFIRAYAKNDFMQTPNIDALARNGCLYENAYSPNPVCIPARHNLITGLTARHHGFDDNYFGEQSKPCPWYLPTFAQILSDAGYSTIAIGKMHFQPERRATGFDSFLNCDEVVKDLMEDEYAQFLRNSGYGDIGSMHGVRNILYMQPQQSLLPEQMHESHWIADRTIEYIRMRKKQERPFLIWTGFIHPHPPLAVPASWAHKYDGKIPGCVSSMTPVSTLARETGCIADGPDDARLNRIRELYACAVSFVDHQIGRIIEALRETGELEHTFVLFTSDHGEMLGDLGAFQKFLPYDPSCRIPFIVQWPGGVAPGTVRRDFVDLNDVLPTFVRLAGTTYPGAYELPGESILGDSVLKNRKYQYAEYQHGSKRWCFLRDERYKFIHYYGDDEQLFDMVEDPHERLNLLYRCTDTAVFGIRDRLRSELLKYEEKYGLEGSVVGGTFRDMPRYEAAKYYEKSYPRNIRRFRGDEPQFRPLEEDIFEAIRDEPSVKLSKLHIRESLTKFGGFTDERVDALLERAKAEGRY